MRAYFEPILDSPMLPVLQLNRAFLKKHKSKKDKKDRKVKKDKKDKKDKKHKKEKKEKKRNTKKDKKDKKGPAPRVQRPQCNNDVKDETIECDS